MTLSVCGEAVRKYDPDRFLLSLFVPPDKREALWALYAFNHEVAKTREVVTETQLGLIRLQWWRDVLRDFYQQKKIAANPVMESVCAAIDAHGLPQDLFDNLIYAREFDLEDRLPSNIDGMVKYAEFTHAPLFNLARSIVIPANTGIQKDVSPAYDSGVAAIYALTGLLRSVPHHTRQRRCYLPEDLLRQNGITVDDLYAGKNLEKLKPAVKDIIQRIDTIVISLKAGILDTDSHVRRNDKWRRLHLKLAQMYLAQIERCDYDIFDSRLLVPPFARELRLWWASA